MRDPGVEQAAGQRAGLRVARHRGTVPPAGHVPGPGRAEPQHPGGVTARDDRPAGQRARPRIGAQPESRRHQLVSWPLACGNRRTSGPVRADSLRHLPRVLRLPSPEPAPSVTARYAASHRAGDERTGSQERTLGYGSRYFAGHGGPSAPAGTEDHDMDRSRLEAFSDGVFAVAITLLALDLTVEGPGHGRLIDQLYDKWPAFLA